MERCDPIISRPKTGSRRPNIRSSGISRGASMRVSWFSRTMRPKSFPLFESAVIPQTSPSKPSSSPHRLVMRISTSRCSQVGHVRAKRSPRRPARWVPPIRDQMSNLLGTLMGLFSGFMGAPVVRIQGIGREDSAGCSGGARSLWINYACLTCGFVDRSQMPEFRVAEGCPSRYYSRLNQAFRHPKDFLQ